jgi:two-component system, NarL family, response regulator LiaR
MRVLMIDDHRLLAEAIRIALEANGFEVVGIEATAEAGMRALRDDPCDMALVDVGLPDESGIDLGRRILEELPGVRVVALTGFLDAASMDEAVGAGFHGYLTKDTPLTELVGYLRAVAEGQVVGPRRAMMTAFVDPRSAGEIVAERLAAQLTSRERDPLDQCQHGADARSEHHGQVGGAFPPRSRGVRDTLPVGCRPRGRAQMRWSR